jgi:uncharacterized membrane protein YozB (DUF420 family)
VNEPPLLPTVNAVLNGSAAVCLWFGRRAIAAGDRNRHRSWMTGALAASGLFLACYLYYHFHVGATRYQGAGIARWVYFAILLTHTPLATLMLPFVGAAVWFAIRGDFKRHTRITRVLWPVWMYVSVTGVLIYAILYILPA